MASFESLHFLILKHSTMTPGLDKYTVEQWKAVVALLKEDIDDFEIAEGALKINRIEVIQAERPQFVLLVLSSILASMPAAGASQQVTNDAGGVLSFHAGATGLQNSFAEVSNPIKLPEFYEKDTRQWFTQVEHFLWKLISDRGEQFESSV